MGWILNKRSCEQYYQDHQQNCIDRTWVSDRKEPVGKKGKEVLEDLLDIEASEQEEEIKEEEEEEEVAPRKYQVIPKGRSPASENQKEAVDKKGKHGRPKKQRMSVEKEVKKEVKKEVETVEEE